MNKYEAVYILDDRKVEGNGSAFVKEIEAAVSELGGKCVSTECIGRRQFATPIKKRTAGTYWDLVFEVPAAGVAVLKDRFRLNPSLLRAEIFAYDKPEVTVIERKRLESESESDSDEEITD